MLGTTGIKTKLDTAEQVTRCRSHRNRQIKYAENAAAFFFRKKIGNKGRRDGDKGRFADPHQGMANQQFRIGVCDCRE